MGWQKLAAAVERVEQRVADRPVQRASSPEREAGPAGRGMQKGLFTSALKGNPGKTVAQEKTAEPSKQKPGLAPEETIKAFRPDPTPGSGRENGSRGR